MRAKASYVLVSIVFFICTFFFGRAFFCRHYIRLELWSLFRKWTGRGNWTAAGQYGQCASITSLVWLLQPPGWPVGTAWVACWNCRNGPDRSKDGNNTCDCESNAPEVNHFSRWKFLVRSPLLGPLLNLFGFIGWFSSTATVTCFSVLSFQRIPVLFVHWRHVCWNS
jgi:hypothetical protein